MARDSKHPYAGHTSKQQLLHAKSVSRVRVPSPIKTRKDTPENLIFWGIPPWPSDLGLWWR